MTASRAGGLVFVDTSAWIARFLESDSNHDAADREARRILRSGRRFITSNYVFDELVTRMRRIADPGAARAVGEALRKSRLVERVYGDQTLEEAAWALFLKLKEHDLSFTDATCVALMKVFDIREIFTFDSDFARVGLSVLPG